MTAPATLLAILARRPSSAESDADLLGRFVSESDAAAFEELVHRYARLVWRVARTRCRTEATAEDVFQATFVVLHRKANSIRNLAALAGWLHLTVHRLAVRATRRERPTVPLPPVLQYSADPLDALTARELLAAVDDELAKLTETERAVLLLCGIDGVSNAEAAGRLGWSTGSVKGRLERARGKLRERLSARGMTLPTVLVGLIGFTPPASAIETAVAIPIGAAISPSVAKLVTETFTMKAKTTLAASVAGLFLLAGGFMTDNAMTPTVDAAPLPKELRPLPKEVWGEAKDGLQAGLRMPEGVTLAVGESKEIQVVVRYVGKALGMVEYTPQQPGVFLLGDSRDGKFQLDHGLFINGTIPGTRSVFLNSGEEFIRWRGRVRHAPPNDALPREASETRFDLTSGTYAIVMSCVGGNLTSRLTDIDGTAIVLPYGLDVLGTGELQVRCIPPRPSPRRNAPVPKQVKAVLWSEPVRVDWKGSRADSINGVWAPDSKSVLVPTPTMDDKGVPIVGGGVDFRDAVSGKVVTTYHPAQGSSKATYLPARLSACADGKTVAAVGSTYEAGKKAEPKWGLYLWQGSTEESPGKLMSGVGTETANELAISSDGGTVVVCDGQAARLFDARRGLMLATTSFRPKKLGQRAALTFHSNTQIVVGTDDGQLFVIDTATGRILEKRAGLGVNCRALATSPEGKFVALGGSSIGEKGHALTILDGDLTSAKLVEPKVIDDALPAKERINSLAFSPDGKHLVAACSDGILRVFDVKSGKLAVSAKEHKAEMFSVAYSPDGKKLLTVGRDAMKVWDVSTLMVNK